MSDIAYVDSPAPQIGADLTIIVRAGADTDAPHRGTLCIGEWSVPCVVGRAGIVPPSQKREGDGATPAGRFALRYGFYEPGTFADADMAALAFPFKPKPDSYEWIETPQSPDYNRMRARSHNEPAPMREAHLFDMFIPLGWNDAVPEVAAGSAIFLHAARPAMTGTAGCVAVPHAALMDLARRLRPGMVIDIAADQPVVAPIAARSSETLEVVAFHSLTPGPRVIVTGAVHGNEICGPRAITRMIAEFRSGARRLHCGSVTFVPVVNDLAFRLDRREGDRNLNRALRDYPVPIDHEDRVANVLCPLLRAHDVLIDLHSFAAEGPAFALLGPTEADALEPRVQPATERALVAALGLPFAVYGWMPAHLAALRTQGRQAEIGHAVGTTEFMRFVGGAAITVECGQHKDPAAIGVAYDVIDRGLAQLGLTDAPTDTPPPPVLLQIGEAIFAESDDDRLIRRFPTGAPVRQGEVIGMRASGAEIIAPHDGAVIFASGTVQAGTELCFLCRPGRV